MLCYTIIIIVIVIIVIIVIIVHNNTKISEEFLSFISACFFPLFFVRVQICFAPFLPYPFIKPHMFDEISFLI